MTILLHNMHPKVMNDDADVSNQACSVIVHKHPCFALLHVALQFFHNIIKIDFFPPEFLLYMSSDTHGRSMFNLFTATNMLTVRSQDYVVVHI